MQFLVEYLEQYTVPAGTKVNDATCKEFFSGIVTDFSGAHEHYYLFDYLMKISERYKEDGCAKMFILNLLQLGVPKLFSGVYMHVQRNILRLECRKWHANWHEKGQVIAKSSLVPEMEEQLIEETGLKCCICLEGCNIVLYACPLHLVPQIVPECTSQCYFPRVDPQIPLLDLA